MNIFTEHTREQGVTYKEHLVFAISIAGRLANTVIAFTLHGVFPFIDIKKELDLEATARFITKKNDWIEGKKMPPASQWRPVKPGHVHKDITKQAAKTATASAYLEV